VQLVPERRGRDDLAEAEGGADPAEGLAGIGRVGPQHVLGQGHQHHQRRQHREHAYDPHHAGLVGERVQDQQVHADEVEDVLGHVDDARLQRLGRIGVAGGHDGDGNEDSGSQRRPLQAPPRSGRQRPQGPHAEEQRREDVSGRDERTVLQVLRQCSLGLGQHEQEENSPQ